MPATEEQVGITETLGSHRGFRAIVKQHIEDFVVQEVLKDGRIAQITNIPNEFGEPTVQGGEVGGVGGGEGEADANGKPDTPTTTTTPTVFEEPLTETPEDEKYSELDNIFAGLTDVKPSEVVKNLLAKGTPLPSNATAQLPPCTDKVKRRLAHHWMKRNLRACTADTLEGGVIRLRPVRKGRGSKRGRRDEDEDVWRRGLVNGSGEQRPTKKTKVMISGDTQVEFILWKRNFEQIDAMHTLSRSLRCHVRNLSFAGMKDKRGITQQLIRVKGVRNLGFFARVNENALYLGGLPVMAIGNVTPKERGTPPLHLGDLKGNRFTLVLRDVEDLDKEENVRNITMAVNSLRERGFVNYFGMQRFGSGVSATHETGFAVLRNDFKEACRRILLPLRVNTPQRESRKNDREAIVDLLERFGRNEISARKVMYTFPKRMKVESAILESFASDEKHVDRKKDGEKRARAEEKARVEAKARAEEKARVEAKARAEVKAKAEAEEKAKAEQAKATVEGMTDVKEEGMAEVKEEARMEEVAKQMTDAGAEAKVEVKESGKTGNENGVRDVNVDINEAGTNGHGHVTGAGTDPGAADNGNAKAEATDTSPTTTIEEAKAQKKVEQLSYNYDYERAFNQLPRSLRMMYAHAVQSYLFNRMASARVRYMRPDCPERMHAVAGDLIIDGEADDDHDNNNDNAGGDDLKCTTPVRTVTKEEELEKAISVRRVLLPVIGTEVELPETPWGDAVRNDLDEQGVDWKKALLNLRFNLKGTYRKLLALPEDLEFEIKEYEQFNHHNQSRINNGEKEEKSVEQEREHNRERDRECEAERERKKIIPNGIENLGLKRKERTGKKGKREKNGAAVNGNGKAEVNSNANASVYGKVEAEASIGTPNAGVNANADKDVSMTVGNTEDKTETKAADTLSKSEPELSVKGPTAPETSADALQEKKIHEVKTEIETDAADVLFKLRHEPLDPGPTAPGTSAVAQEKNNTNGEKTETETAGTTSKSEPEPLAPGPTVPDTLAVAHEEDKTNEVKTETEIADSTSKSEAEPLVKGSTAPETSAISQEENKINSGPTPMKSDKDDEKRHALVLSFSLSTSQYATMLVRELTKQDSTTANQKALQVKF